MEFFPALGAILTPAGIQVREKFSGGGVKSPIFGRDDLFCQIGGGAGVCVKSRLVAAVCRPLGGEPLNQMYAHDAVYREKSHGSFLVSIFSGFFGAHGIGCLNVINTKMNNWMIMTVNT